MYYVIYAYSVSVLTFSVLDRKAQDNITCTPPQQQKDGLPGSLSENPLVDYAHFYAWGILYYKL